MDLMAETFAEAFAGRQRLVGDAEDASRWLYGIAHHQLSRFFRKGRAETKMLRRLGLEREVLDSSEQDRLERVAELAELRAEVSAAISRVPAGQREAVRLRVVEELSYGELAARLGVSGQTARARVSRGLRRLADVLSHEPEVQTREVTA